MNLFGVSLSYNQTIHLGKGEIFLSDYRPEETEFQPTIGCKRGFTPPFTMKAVPSKWNMQKAGTGKLLRSLLTPKAELISDNDRLVVTSFDVKDARVFHIVNLADTISTEAKSVSHEDLIPNFCEGAKKLGAITLHVKERPPFEVKSACLLTPEQNEPQTLVFSEEGDGFAIKIPENIFSAYAMVVLE